jgi:uncharacterized membrane protein YfcA
LPLGLAGIIGLEMARSVVLELEEQGIAGEVLRWVYVALLFGVGLLVLQRELRTPGETTPARGSGGSSLRAAPDASGRESASTDDGVPPSRGSAEGFLRVLTRGPRLDVVPGRLSVPLVGLLITGVLVGALSGFLGPGGGFVLVPLLIYVFRVPPSRAVAASLLSIAISTSVGAYGYWSVGRVELLAAGLMFVGAIAGTQLGALTTAAAPAGRLQILLGLMLVAAGTAVALRQATWFAVSAAVIFSGATAMCAVILGLLVRARRRSGFSPL